MTKTQAEQADNADDDLIDDDEVCPDCGGLIEQSVPPDAVFGVRVCLMNEILCHMDPWDQGRALALLVSEHLGTLVKPTSRQSIRDQIIQLIDDGTAAVIERMAASLLPPDIEQKLALMAQVSSLLN